jgi:ACS family sodium-dependent inorganic phosphate cotransporter
MLGVTNTAASLPGAFGVAMVGFLLDKTDRCWEVSLLAPAAAVLSVSAVVYAMFGSNDTIDFDAQDDSPFTWEKKLCDLKDAVGKAAASVGIFRSQEDS